MADKKNTPKKNTKKKTAAKPAKSKAIKPAVIEVEKEVLVYDNSMKPCPCKNAIKFLLTIIISAIVTASIVITTPLWMDKMLPTEKQPAFLRKSLMPVTNVKVIRTKPLPNDIEKLIDAADKHLQIKLSALETNMTNELSNSTKEYNEGMNDINKKLDAVSNQSKYIDQNWKNRAIQYKMFLVSFYNLYGKAMSGRKYDNELELMLLSLEEDMLIHKDLPWIIAYKDMPPRSMRSMGREVGDKYSDIIIENIRANDSGLKGKISVAINSMFTITTPSDKLPEGSLKYNLSKFMNAAKMNNSCQAMRYGKELSAQSNWFKSNIMNELEARYKINKQLKAIKHKIEVEVYEDQIDNLEDRLTAVSETQKRFYQRVNKKPENKKIMNKKAEKKRPASRRPSRKKRGVK